MIEDKLKEILSAGLMADVALQNSGLTKEDVKPLADAGNLDAAYEDADEEEWWRQKYFGNVG